LKKTSNKKRFVLYIAAAIAVVAILFVVLYSQSPAKITYDFSRAANPEYYSLLPPMPSDFGQIQLLWQQGAIRDDPERINSSYWKQPEWFPLYTLNFVPTLKTIAEDERLAVWSLGVFDSQIYNRVNRDWLSNATSVPETIGKGVVEIGNNSIIIKHRFWIRAAPGAAKIYGVGLYPVYPSSAYLKGNDALGIPNDTLYQNPNVTEKYMSISAFDKETVSAEFNMGVYWPKLNPDYVREIEVTVEINKDTPKGTYILGIDAAAPSKEYQEEQSMKYLLKYTDPSIGMARFPSEFRLFVEIM
jgi:hypothetical protein